MPLGSCSLNCSSAVFPVQRVATVIRDGYLHVRCAWSAGVMGLKVMST